MGIAPMITKCRLIILRNLPVPPLPLANPPYTQQKAPQPPNRKTVGARRAGFIPHNKQRTELEAGLVRGRGAEEVEAAEIAEEAEA